jgi:hypothetical protein
LFFCRKQVLFNVGRSLLPQLLEFLLFDDRRGSDLFLRPRLEQVDFSQLAVKLFCSKIPDVVFFEVRTPARFVG